jgi:hypothetical protein
MGIRVSGDTAGRSTNWPGESIFLRAIVLFGRGIAACNFVLLLFVTLATDLELADVRNALLTTSAVMLTVGWLACVEPARRALRIRLLGASALRGRVQTDAAGSSFPPRLCRSRFYGQGGRGVLGNDGMALRNA